jgi:hypothetical protein
LALEMTVAKAMIHKISYDKFTVILKQKWHTYKKVTPKALHPSYDMVQVPNVYKCCFSIKCTWDAYNCVHLRFLDILGIQKDSCEGLYERLALVFKKPLMTKI